MSTKKLFQNTLLYSFSGLILRASSIILFPIFSYYLSSADYGILSITGSILLLASTIAMFELPRAITRYIYVQENNQNNKDKYISTAIITVFAIHIVFAVILSLAGKFILKPVLNDISFYPYMLVAIMALPFTALFDFYKQLKKAEQQGHKAFWAEILYYGFNILFNLIFVVGFKMDALGIILSTLVVAILFTFYLLIFEIKIVSVGFSWSLLQHLLKYSLPVFVFILFGILMENTDRLFLNYKINASSSGIYYIALTFASVFSILKESINSSLTPWFYKQYENKHYKEVGNIFRLILVSMTMIAIILSWFGYETLYILSSNRELLAAYEYIPFVLFSLYIVFIGQTFNLFVFYEISKTKYLIWSNLAGFITNLVLCWLLIPVMLEKGAAISRLMAFAVMTLIQIWIGLKFAKVKISFRFVFLLISINIVLSSIIYLPIPYTYLLMTKIILSIVLLIFLYVYIKKSLGIGKINLKLLSDLLKK